MKIDFLDWCTTDDMKKCWTYMFRVNEFVKIGRSVDVLSRLRKLQTGLPWILEPVCVLDEPERSVHQRFKCDFVRGEWFVESEMMKGWVHEAFESRYSQSGRVEISEFVPYGSKGYFFEQTRCWRDDRHSLSNGELQLWADMTQDKPMGIRIFEDIPFENKEAKTTGRYDKTAALRLDWDLIKSMDFGRRKPFYYKARKQWCIKGKKKDGTIRRIQIGTSREQALDAFQKIQAVCVPDPTPLIGI